MFGISSTMASLFTIPATYATAFGFIYAYGKLLIAMAESKLFPHWLQRRSHSGSPGVALAAGSALSFLVCGLVYFVPGVDRHLFNICILNAFISYSAQCVGYIYLRTRFSNIKREFRSPLGIYGAVYCLLVSLLGAVSVIGFQDDNQVAFITVLCIVFLLTLYYFTYAKSRQTFSDEERKILFVAHVINRTYYFKRDFHGLNSFVLIYLFIIL